MEWSRKRESGWNNLKGLWGWKLWTENKREQITTPPVFFLNRWFSSFISRPCAFPFKKKIKISTQKRINHTDRKILYHTIVFMIWFRPFLFQFLCLFCYYSYTDFCLTILILCYIYTRRQTNVSSNVDKIVYLKDFLYSTLLLYNSRPRKQKIRNKAQPICWMFTSIYILNKKMGQRYQNNSSRHILLMDCW
jgi:hypothetical protein